MNNIDKARKAVDEEVRAASKEDKPIETSYIETKDYILEQIQVATDATDATRTQGMYIKYNKAKNTTELVEHEFIENKEYRPIIDDLLDKKAIILPTDVEEYGETSDLVKEIEEFFYASFEVPKFYEKFLPYLCLFYWVYDKFPFIPYIHFVGRTSTGKTTAMEVFGSICYKPIDASGAITLSPIFRTSNMWRGTLLLDEFETSGDGYKELIAFLKSGTGDRKVLRTEGEGTKSVKAHIAKSPKVFTSERPVTDAGLQSRTITVMMNESTRRIPLYRLKGFTEQAEKLRNKLLLWRLRNLNKIDLKDIEYGFPELEGFDRRVQQVVTPIYYLADKAAREDILKFAKEHQTETLRERREALDGIIFEAIVEQHEAGEDVTISKIIEKINDDKVTPKRVANTIRKILGFEIDREGHENIRIVNLKGQEDKIKHLCLYYGIHILGVQVAQVAQVANDRVFTEEETLDLWEEELKQGA